MAEQFAAIYDLPEEINTGIAKLGWKRPMPVQTQVIPIMLGGEDLIVQAQTGSGKTGAFGIPIVSSVDPKTNDTQAIVLAPTRELANQVCSELATLAEPRGVRCLAVYGGVGYGPQIEGLKKGAHIIVGTPGRILDHLGNGRLSLKKVRQVVFDEADEMLSLGFWPDMKEIREYLPKKRQSCLFSATMPEKVLALSRAFLSEPKFISLVGGHSSPSEIEHVYYLTSAQEKEKNLRIILETENPDSAIVFCNTKDDVRYVTAFLQRHGFDADQISGDLNQGARERAMSRIKAGELRILVATDVAARGIDISGLSHVISYTAPETPETYVHRTGRTGRAGKAGMAISLVSGLDIGNFQYLQKVNKITAQERQLPTEKDLVDHRRELLIVKINQEIRKIPEGDRAAHLEPWVPVVEALAGSETGLRDLAAICVNFLQDRLLETRIEEDSSITTEAEVSDSEKQPFKRKRRRRPSSNSRTKNRDAKS
tara:strand:- start:650 stop:2098 length:1449 start_codon:yes stop_codon:yes gene_type:complete